MSASDLTTSRRRPTPAGDTRYISTDVDWTFETIEAYDQAIGESAERFGLDTYPSQIEIISSEQMMDAYASAGMPIGYPHWSYGKRFVETEAGYRRGQMGLAYEIVINSDPCIAYLMEENSMTMQALVIAHACYGHNAFFKGNYLFRAWTDATGIVDYLVFAKNFIRDCETRHGIDATEQLLDSCHAIMNYGVDRYQRPTPLSPAEEAARLQQRARDVQRQVNDLWRTIPTASVADNVTPDVLFPPEPQENLLYFFEKHAPNLEPWQREVVRIVRKLAQYFYPQRQTQVMNEGWATFWHYTLLNDLYDRDLVNDAFMFEFLTSHTNVIRQPAFDEPGFGGINPYALGFAMMRDLRRICEAPDDEDREWFPDIAGSHWTDTMTEAMRSYKDESFIQQFLSPRVIRDFRLFAIVDDDKEDAIAVPAIHEAVGYREVRELLARQYAQEYAEPAIQVERADIRGDRALTLVHNVSQRRALGEDTDEILRHIHRLWQFEVRLESREGESVVGTWSCG